MKRALFVITGVSVVFTTLAFGHIMYHDTVHMLARHEESHLFLAVHTLVAAALGVLSLLGAYLLLSGGRVPFARYRANPIICTFSYKNNILYIFVQIV